MQLSHLPIAASDRAYAAICWDTPPPLASGPQRRSDIFGTVAARFRSMSDRSAMKLTRIFAVATVAIGLAGILPAAQAAQPGFYVGGLYGQTEKQVDIAGFDTYATTRVFPSPNVQLTVDSMTS